MNFLKYIFIKIANISKLFSRKGLNQFITNEIFLLENKNYKALTIGSGGDTEKFIKKNTNINLISIDINKNKKPDILMDVNELNFDENSFDLVFLFEVLEHLPNPQNAIDQIYKVLKPSGIIFLSTPFALEIHGAPNDFYRFSKHGIMHLLSRFKNIKVKERNTYFESINVLLIRLIQSNYPTDRIIGVFFLFLSIIFLPITFIFNFLIRSKSLTTGYVCKAQK